jgi:hypothetical protein
MRWIPKGIKIKNNLKKLKKQTPISKNLGEIFKN